MRRLNIETAVIKLLIFASSVILTCILVTIGTINFKQSRQMANMTANKINEYTQNLIQADIMNYDGLSIRGSDVINFYKKHLGNVDAGKKGEFLITVITYQGSGTSQRNNTYQDGSYLDKMKNNNDLCYIKPTGKFTGTVITNKNGVITKVVFSQE